MIGHFKVLEQMLLSRGDRPTLGVVCAHDLHTLEAVQKAVEKNLIRAVLIGEEELIRQEMAELNFRGDGVSVLHADSDAACAAQGVRLARAGEVQALMKGKIQTRDFLRAVVDSESGIRRSKVLSHLAMHELAGYHKIFAVTDGGMCLYPDLEQKRAIIENAAGVFRSLGYEMPKVAVLAAVEKVNPKMPETVDAKALREMGIPGCIVEGPISYDLTFSRESAAIKGFESPVVGDADILIVPNITTGNILGKSLIYSAGARMAGIIVGAQVPIVLTSRGASAAEKYDSIILAVLSH